MFKSNLPSMYYKRKAFNQSVLQILTYGGETMTHQIVNKEDENCSKKMKRSMIGLPLRDRMKIEDIRGRTKVDYIIEHIIKNK